MRKPQPAASSVHSVPSKAGKTMCMKDNLIHSRTFTAFQPLNVKSASEGALCDGRLLDYNFYVAFSFVKNTLVLCYVGSELVPSNNSTVFNFGKST